MLIIRWFLSKLTLFLLLFIVVYLLFKWYFADGENFINQIPNNLSVLTGETAQAKKPAVLAPQPEKPQPEKPQPEQLKNSDNSAITKKAAVNDQIETKEKNLKEVNQQDSSSVNDNKPEKIITQKPENNTAEAPVEQQTTKQKASLDELVTLLMSGKNTSENRLLKNIDKLNRSSVIQQKWKTARDSLNSGDYSKAEKEYLELIELKPEYADFYSELSNLYFVIKEIKKYNDTLIALARLYIRNNNNYMAQYYIGLLKDQSPEDARTLQQELQNNPLKAQN